MRQTIALSLGILLVILSAAAVGCAGEPVADEPAPEPAAEAVPIADPPVLDEEPSAEELPVAEDFEEEVATAITSDNYGSELDALEKEIGADQE